MSTVAAKDDKRKKNGAYLRALPDTTGNECNGELFKTLFSDSPIGIYVVQGGKFQFINHQYARYLAYGEDELLGKESLSFVHPDDRNIVRENAIKMLKGEHSSPCEFRVIDKAGDTKWVLETAISIKYQGKLATLGNFIDITERKRMEQELLQSEERLKQYLENAPDAVYINDLKGEFLYGNKKAEELTGYSKKELIGKSFLKLKMLKTKQFARAVKLLSLNALGKPTGPDEFELIKKDGSRALIEINTNPIKQGGKTLVVGFARDVTERKRIDEALEKSE
jgi:PAS domain S-box-containing protein